jgi:hypothetical protein
MPEMTPNVPPGARPSKPGDSGKVQPKKETVRINLPPRPTASPTIRLPSLPSGAPAGAAPPPAPAGRPGDSSKVLPKKQTVRINLPPKPTASPTIKLPSLPSGAAPPGSAAAAAPAAQGANTPKPPAPPPSGSPGSRIANAPAAQRPAATGSSRPAPIIGGAVATADKVLAVIAAVVSLGALLIILYFALYLPDHYLPGS